MNDERIVTGYCRKLDGSRVLCLELEDGEWRTDCLYPGCEFVGTCRLMETALAETEWAD